jgi:polyhydroxyalkanoate synthesis repressor PhaR
LRRGAERVRLAPDNPKVGAVTDGAIDAGGGGDEVAGEEDAAKAPIIIKKYANRRLYNTSKSCYVTLDHLAEMVREKQDFVVRDAKSGDDITRSVLTQIIVEEEAKGQNLLPINFLRQLIRLYGDALQGVVPGYLDSSMETFTRNQEALREQVATAMGVNPALANFEAMARKNLEMFEGAMRMFTPFGATGSEQKGAKDAGIDPGNNPEKAPAKSSGEGEIDLLKKQLAAMQDQLNNIAKDR